VSTPIQDHILVDFLGNAVERGNVSILTISIATPERHDLLGVLVDQTNARMGKPMVLYRCHGQSMTHVRDQ
jgi:hypothetical protein